MVENFGSYLKHERELRGVPLEEISGATKIHIRYLKALEENSFDQLPGEVFIKGYIRSYADIIGSDVEEMLNIYKETVELNKKENASRNNTSSNPRSKTLIAYVMLVLAIAGLLFGVGSLIKNGIDGSSDKLEVRGVSIQQIPVEEVVQETSIISSTKISEKQHKEKISDAKDEDSAKLEIAEFGTSTNPSDQSVSNENLDEKKLPSPQETVDLSKLSLQASLPILDAQNPEEIIKPLKLLIRVNEISWFSMTIDNYREEDFILPAGTVKTFWGNEIIRLTVGNKTGVELVLNDKAIALPKSKDKVVKDFIIDSKLVD